MTSHERPRTVVRADVLAARLFQDAVAHSRGTVAPHRLRDIAAESYDNAAIFVRETARRDPLTGELSALRDGLPADVEESARG